MTQQTKTQYLIKRNRGNFFLHNIEIVLVFLTTALLICKYIIRQKYCIRSNTLAKYVNIMYFTIIMHGDITYTMYQLEMVYSNCVYFVCTQLQIVAMFRKYTNYHYVS